MVRMPRFGAAKLACIRLAAVCLAPLALTGCQQGAGAEQSLVDRAALTVQEMMTQKVSQDPQVMLRRAKAVMICPRVFKAGFFVGGEGGSCVMLARSGNGTWSYPTFYDIGSGSFGFQFGVQDSQLMLLIMTNRGLNAVMDSQVRLGANVSVAVATVGAGVQGSTTAAVGADILAFAEARGLFGGVSLEGGIMSARVDENLSYYGQPLAARQVVQQMQGVNAGADPLREVLTRFGGAEPMDQGPPPSAYQSPASPGYPPAGGQPGYPSDSQPPSGRASVPPAYQPPPGQPPYSPSYPPPAAPRASSQGPSMGPGPAQPPSGYQPPPGQYTYPPPSNTGPIQEQSLPPPGH